MSKIFKSIPTVSICIPTYEMNGKGSQFLEESFEILSRQTFRDFEVIISDHSKNNSIKRLSKKYSHIFRLKYYRNHVSIGNSSANINNSILKAQGRLIKILFQDDLLYSDTALEQTVSAFDTMNATWLITASEHSYDGITCVRPFYPKYVNNIYLGNNTISSPSVLTIKNDKPLLFDENLIWLMDCDYYKRCYETFGEPKILNQITVINRIGTHQITSKTTEDLKQTELEYCTNKFEQAAKPIQLKNVTLVAVSGIDPTGALQALEYSMSEISYYEAVLISHTKPNNLPKNIVFKKCKSTELQNKNPKDTTDYSKFIAYDLHQYITSDYALLVHKNAHVLRPLKWSNSFLKYDYIGAPWPKNIHYTNEGVNVRVGNGGFSLRSMKIMKALEVLKLPFTDNGSGYYNEDGLLCVYHRSKLEKYGIKYAPVEVAAEFSGETYHQDSSLEPFGFHDNKKYVPTFFYLKYFLKKLFKRI